MNDTYDIAELEDDEENVYVIGIDHRTTHRTAEIISERFDDLLDEAKFLVIAGMETEGVSIREFDAEEVKHEVEAIRNADSAEAAEAAVEVMLDDDE